MYEGCGAPYLIDVRRLSRRVRAGGRGYGSGAGVGECLTVSAGFGEVSSDESVTDCDGLWPWVFGEGVAGVEPSLFEGGLDVGFDVVGDVAVDLDDTLVHTVAQPSGLGDFGDAGGDEPGFVAVS